MPLQRKSADSVARYGFALIEGRTSAPDEIAHVEDRMGVIFPDKYKVDGRCREQVWFHFHDADDREPVAADFLEFVAEYGLKSSTDRALERRHR